MENKIGIQESTDSLSEPLSASREGVKERVDRYMSTL